MIRFDLDERHVFDQADQAMPWFVRVIIADVAFWALFAFILGPWIALLAILWPRPAPVTARVPEEKTPLVFMQPQEIPRDLLRPRPSVTPTPAPKPPDHVVLPGNTKPFEVGDPPAPQPTKPEPPAPEPPRPEPQTQIARNTATAPPVPAPGRDDSPHPPATGVLGRALQNLDRYAQTQSPANPLGGATDPGSASVQFDTKGVNFDPWLRRFVSQVRRNWFVPLSAMNFKGRVVLQFIIHKDGRITDVHVAQPSDIESFNRAAYNAIVGSNPTEPFPPEYPDEAAPFTVTFFYNERPPG